MVDQAQLKIIPISEVLILLAFSVYYILQFTALTAYLYAIINKAKIIKVIDIINNIYKVTCFVNNNSVDKTNGITNVKGSDL
ncbi:hypothetical protein J2746_002650 [Methanolobus bombayensis]|nr:hypothetical protein [Methanolobus bombayensis]